MINGNLGGFRSGSFYKGYWEDGSIGFSCAGRVVVFSKPRRYHMQYSEFFGVGYDHMLVSLVIKEIDQKQRTSAFNGEVYYQYSGYTSQ
jgi:hypothetical protein